MKTLPADLADPLHILSPFPWRILALVVAAAFLAWLWTLWRRRRRSRGPSAAPTPAPATAPRATGLKYVIDGIELQHVDADRRQGCHELSSALRGHYQARGGHPFSTSTVREITAAIGDGAVSRFFGLLADFQFGRREPSRDDFRGLCDLARDVVAVDAPFGAPR